MKNPSSSPSRRKYTWPRYLLAAVILGFVICIGAMVKLALKIKRGKASFAEQNGSASANPPSRPGTNRTDDLSWTNGMRWIPGGAFWMGSETGPPDERPVHQVSVDGFWMDATEVTNEQFERFVRATGYVTLAEKQPNIPDALPELNKPGSIVFTPPSLDALNRERAAEGLPPVSDVPLDNHFIWWRYVPDANWRHPEGPGSTIQGRDKHPVVHVCWDDAVACARWAGKRLPTEAEWEFASRGGLEKLPYTWGAEQVPGGKWRANIWQGRFPTDNSLADGFRTTSPAGTFPPNGYGLYDMAGNVWDWCADWYLPDYYGRSPAKNPPGPDTSYDPNEPGAMKRVQRGGSYLCSDVYCSGYKPAARMKATPDTALSHAGFRCVRSR